MTRTTASIALEPPSGIVRAGLLLVSLALPAVTLPALFAIAGRSADGRLFSSAHSPSTVALMVGIVALAAVAAWAFHRRLNRQHLSIDRNGLDIATSFYRRRLALGELDIEQARIVDLEEHTSLKPLFKTNGAAFPGYQSGWFRLRNGKRALVARSGGTRVLWIPTRRNFDLLLQPVHPQSLLDALRELTIASDPRAIGRTSRHA